MPFGSLVARSCCGSALPSPAVEAFVDIDINLAALALRQFLGRGDVGLLPALPLLGADPADWTEALGAAAAQAWRALEAALAGDAASPRATAVLTPADQRAAGQQLRRRLDEALRGKEHFRQEC